MKSNQDTRPFNENIEKEYQKLLETLSPEQEEVITKYCDEIFASGAETEEFFYRLGIKDGLRLKSTIKSVLEMMADMMMRMITGRRTTGNNNARKLWR